MIKGEEVLLYQVWMNLLSNAVKYISNGRSIRITAEQLNEHCVVYFTDSGEGIPEEELPFLFDRFYRVDRVRERTLGSSAGLGLSIVQKIIRLHEGMIEVESSTGRGTSFKVTLPSL